MNALEREPFTTGQKLTQALLICGVLVNVAFFTFLPTSVRWFNLASALFTAAMLVVTVRLQLQTQRTRRRIRRLESYR